MKVENITIKNITTNELLVGTQLEWNIWLSPGYILDLILAELKKQYPESEFKISDVKVKSVRAIFNSAIE
mgnify:CR=1 FL=1